MTIPEAVHLILKAWIMGENNDLFVLDMGEPIKIYELAKWIIAINGYIPEKDIKIEVTGLRPGEKLYEELLVNEESTAHTKVDNIFKTKNYLKFDRIKYLYNLTYLEESLESSDFNVDDIKKHLKLMISTYNPSPN
jgi:FlaA1/EpsC-like NDP-sugar epimerase